jgi:hypothetical protein
VVGIADYDHEGIFGMPASDREAALKDAEWHNRPDYAGNPWLPDGIDRDNARFTRGFQVIRSNPAWFGGVMTRRAAFMLRYNSSGPARWPFNTSMVPVVSAEVPVGNPQSLRAETGQPNWSSSGADLLAQADIHSAQAEVYSGPRRSIRIIGDESIFGDQFATAPIAVESNTDYLLLLRVGPASSSCAAKVTDLDRRTALVSLVVENVDSPRSVRRQTTPSAANEEEDLDSRSLRAAFASGSRKQVRLVVGNDRVGPLAPALELTGIELYALGPTPYGWTRFPRSIVRAVQRTSIRLG